MRRFLQFIGAFWLFAACATSGPVETSLDDSRFEVVPTPTEFSSPLDELARIRVRVAGLESQLPRKLRFHDPLWKEFVDGSQAWDELEQQQSAIESELVETGEIELQPGQSYSLDLDSYCVWPGKTRPLTGDGLQVAPLRGPAEKWIFGILDQQGSKGIRQDRVQYLIWALLTDVRFDELSDENQALLLEFYPDAQTRFRNRRLENLGESLLQELIPSQVTHTLADLSALREKVVDNQSRYAELEAILAPQPTRNTPIPVGWMRMPEGYFLRMSSESYTRVRVDIYVPTGEQSGRSPQSMKKVLFHPSRWVGLPALGQRVALSNRVRTREKRKPQNECERVKHWAPKSCRELSDKDRQQILQFADPKNFPKTRYKQTPGVRHPIEAQTDCSNFVNVIYQRAGFDYEYASTSALSCLSVFKKIAVQDLKPGDLLLYPSHVGILTAEGDVISATVGGEKMVSKLNPGHPEFRPAIRKLMQRQISTDPTQILRWSCP